MSVMVNCDLIAVEFVWMMEGQLWQSVGGGGIYLHDVQFVRYAELTLNECDFIEVEHICMNLRSHSNASHLRSL